MVVKFCERLFTAQFHHAGFTAKNLLDFQRVGGLAGRRWLSETSPVPAPPPDVPSVRSGSRLQYLASLSVDTPPATVRRTGIICTIGPACDSIESLSKLIAAGMTVARLNMSHGTHAEHAERVTRLRRAGSLRPEAPPLAVALDTRGPEIRTGLIPAQDGGGGGSFLLEVGATLRLTADSRYRLRSAADVLHIDHSGLAGSVAPGDTIHLDDGLVTLRVSAVEGASVLCTVETGGRLGSRKSVCVPDVGLSLPAVTEGDRADLRLAAALGVDFVFASFVRDSDGVHELRQALGEEGRRIKIISKIESRQGLENIDSIIAASDGVMVARGDMGVELPPEKVFLAQKSIIAKCNMAGKPAICATQMMESMVSRPRPTRAELSDVANAVLDGADCVMLSAETASGAFPQRTVRLMDRACRQAEATLDFDGTFTDLRSQVCSADTELEDGARAVQTAHQAGVAAILVLTSDGRTAQQLARFRPLFPVLMVTSSEHVARQSRIHCGIVPLVLPGVSAAEGSQSRDDVIRRAIDRAKQLRLLSTGDTVAIIGTENGATNVRMVGVW